MNEGGCWASAEGTVTKEEVKAERKERASVSGSEVSWGGWKRYKCTPSQEFQDHSAETLSRLSAHKTSIVSA